MAKLFGLAQDTHQVYGHGDTGTELRICRMGPYGTGEFPPVFTSRKNAEDWILHCAPEYSQFHIVEIELWA